MSQDWRKIKLPVWRAAVVQPVAEILLFVLDRVGGCAMPVWEYRQIDLNGLPPKTDEVDVLNELGKQGWELVAILHNHVAYLKRPAIPAQPPRSPRTS